MTGERFSCNLAPLIPYSGGGGEGSPPDKVSIEVRGHRICVE